MIPSGESTPQGISQPPQEQPRKEIYGLGSRIPLFKLSNANINPKDSIRTYTGNFILNAGVIPDLAINVTLGHVGAPSIIMFSETKNLHIQADLDPLVNAGLVNRIRNPVPASFGFHEPCHYTFTDDIYNALTRLRIRVYDGEDRKIYEASPNEYSLRESGKLAFGNDFHEIQLDEKGNVVSRNEQKTPLTYSLNENTGAENTEAEFIFISK